MQPSWGVSHRSLLRGLNTWFKQTIHLNWRFKLSLRLLFLPRRGVELGLVLGLELGLGLGLGLGLRLRFQLGLLLLLRFRYRLWLWFWYWYWLWFWFWFWLGFWLWFWFWFWFRLRLAIAPPSWLSPVMLRLLFPPRTGEDVRLVDDAESLEDARWSK